ncbi:GNAT family N-acetyltransferase [Xenorhabdus sp. 12]|uniref:GNAT family N-acetyltransferase n=1 Tax=Xenorhabdus santafensis TaxID=2582833 RepID=A0ABU4S9N0_9GAMM|nr:GNAT family N-acetyltransferase [Xenorhabdus sp. 12]MDX7987517.1 GNAT family N-acetyltransferase [Xenorhabdus sp. 12]
MMFRSNSFNKNHPSGFKNLSRTTSMPNIKINVSDIRMSLVVKEVDASEARSAINMIMNETMLQKDWEYSIYSETFDELQLDWNDRYSASSKIFSDIENCAKLCTESIQGTENECLFILAYFQGRPVGALQLKLKYEQGWSEVAFLATHCGLRSSGYLLIEFSINKTLQLGRSGKLKLVSKYGARSAYTKMGFETGGNETYYFLDPAKRSDKWRFINGCYKYIGC